MYSVLVTISLFLLYDALTWEACQKLAWCATVLGNLILDYQRLQWFVPGGSRGLVLSLKQYTNNSSTNAFTGLLLGLCPAIMRRGYFVTTSLIGWVQTQRADTRFAPSHWETALLCNGISHWLGANLESALFQIGLLEDWIELKLKRGYSTNFLYIIQIAHDLVREQHNSSS